MSHGLSIFTGSCSLLGIYVNVAVMGTSVTFSGKIFVGRLDNFVICAWIICLDNYIDNFICVIQLLMELFCYEPIQ